MNLCFNKNYNLLVDRPFVNQTVNFYSSDDQKTFKFNCKKLKNKDWQYHTETIEYKFNSLGHRTKEIESLDKDFLLTFGCSYTEGVVLNVEDIWASMLATNLKLDLYNCAKQSTSPEAQYINALLWKRNNLPKPKLVVCQWPQIGRKMFGFTKQDDIEIADMSETKTHDGRWWERRYIVDNGERDKSVIQQIEGFNLVWESLGVPVINFSWEPIEIPLFTKIHEISPNTGNHEARDREHDGVNFHIETQKYLQTLCFSN